jgi:hypothetical protein
LVLTISKHFVWIALSIVLPIAPGGITIAYWPE